MTDENTRASLRTQPSVVVEYAARAICRRMAEINWEDGSLTDVTAWENETPSTRELFRDLAKAALAAQPRDDVREAHGEALHALSAALLANGALEFDEVHGPYERVVNTFKALDTALAPTTQGTDSGLAEQVDKLANTILGLDMRGTEDEGACGVAEIRLREYAALRTVLDEEQRNLLVKCVRGDPVHHDDRMALLRTLHELESTQ